MPAHQIGVLTRQSSYGIRDDVGPLVGIHPQIEYLRNAIGGERLVPDRKAAWILLLGEYRLPVVMAIADQIAIVIEIGEVGARAGLGSLPVRKSSWS